MKIPVTVRRSRFEKLYSVNIDPWDFRTSKYERRKYRNTLRSLPREKYNCAVEAGCSIGELSRLIGGRAKTFYGIDVSNTAIEEARRRNADRPNLHFVQGELPNCWPSLSYDLVVLSEILYFLSRDEIVDFARRITEKWAPEGDCVIVSFLGETSENLQGGESARLMISELERVCGATTKASKTFDGYRIDVLNNNGC